MFESLVATLVFAFGAIGVTGMQNLSMQSTMEAMQRTQAVFLTNNMIERMRNNSSVLGDYDASGNTVWTIVGNGSIDQEPTPNCRQATCNPTQLAAHDLWGWEQAVDGAAVTRQNVGNVGGLVDPTACIRHTGSGSIELAIAWRGKREKINASLGTGCTVDGRYGDDDEFRHVLVVRTYVATP